MKNIKNNHKEYRVYIKEKEEIEEKWKLKNKSLKIHYKIDNQKMQELEKTFKSSKLKVYLTNPINLENGNICSISENKRILKIYEYKNFNILTKIPFRFEITSVIQLNNNDIIVLIREEYANIYIYRLKNHQYYFFQKIIEDGNGYVEKDEYRGCLFFKMKFILEGIKKLPKNKFMTISNYGFKIYSLNENNQYSLILVDAHDKGITQIYEINENNFFFCIDNYIHAAMRNPYNHNYLELEKVKLVIIKTNEINRKLNAIKKGINDDNFREDKKRKLDENEIKKIFESLKFTHFKRKIFGYGEKKIFKKFSDLVILKNKYFIIMVDFNILIFDILKGKKLKEYGVLEEEENILYKFEDIKIKIKKSNNINDNEFIMIGKEKIFLFKLNENSLKDIELNIIAYSYFPEINELIKINEENRFYINKNDFFHMTFI